MKRSLFATGSLACFIAGAALTAPVFAGDRSHADDKVKTMDTNKDGYVSQAEHAAGARKMFEAMDTDRDGKVTATEMETAHDAAMHKDGQHQASTEGRYDKGKTHKMSAAEKIRAVDANSDGVLTAAEHETASSRKFTEMDTNRDGRLTADEIRAGHEKMTSGRPEDKPRM